MSKQIQKNVMHVKDMALAIDFQQRKQEARNQAEIIRKTEEMTLKSKDSSISNTTLSEVQLPCYHIDFPSSDTKRIPHNGPIDLEKIYPVDYF